MKSLKLPKNKHKGMFVYCSKCKKHFSWTEKTEGKKKVEPQCGKSDNVLSKCPFPQNQKYKVRYHISGSNDAKASKSFETRNYNEAVIQAIEIENEVKNNVELISEKKKPDKIHYLVDCQVAYLDYLNNVDVPEHKKRPRSEEHIKEVARCLLFFNESMSTNKVNYKMLRIEKVNDIHIGFFHKYLLKDRNYASRTYNKKMGVLSSFFKWVAKEYRLPILNPFEDVQYRTSVPNNETITQEEYESLMKMMTLENGKRQLGGKRKEVKNFWRTYLKAGIMLSLETNGRREEIVELKWNMIYEIKDEPAFILSENLKVKRQKGEGYNDHVAPKIFAVTDSLKELLYKLGYERYKGQNRYLICPDRGEVSAKTIMNNLSKGFTHYYQLLGTGRKLQLRNLRKTNLSYLHSALGEETSKLTSHTTEQVLLRHYIDPRLILKAQDAKVFSEA